MGSPAARIEDGTEHGGMIVYGTPTTLIGGLPASRLGDMHECPQVTGIVPHVGGPILFASLNVWVGGAPQARVSDLLFCVGPPDLIRSGHEATLVGMDGIFSGGIGGFLSLLAGAYLAGLDNFLHGYPRAVVDPNEPDGYYTQYSKGIHIRGTASFQQNVMQDLTTISSTTVGSNTIKQIDGSGHVTTITEGDDYVTNFTTAGERAVPGGSNNIGSDATIIYPAHPVTVYDGSRPWMYFPSDVGLLHEMRHASDAGNGSMDPGSNNIDGRQTENGEAQATGLGAYKDDPYTENKYRNERNLPGREWY